MWLQAIDFVFWLTHMLVISFNLLGWVWAKTKKVHLIVVSLTLVSWLVLGIWYGIGYCFLTDWHWQVKRQLGETMLPNSFITYFLNNQLGLQINPELIDLCTGIIFVAVVFATLYVNRSYLHNIIKK